jgi:hypothetical protein
VFATHLIMQGRFGGQKAAFTLSREVTEYLYTNYVAKPYQLWIKIFLNKRQLAEACKRHCYADNQTNESIEKQFEEFMDGFSQAGERFLMIDVGAVREVADAKLKGVPRLTSTCWFMR